MKTMGQTQLGVDRPHSLLELAINRITQERTTRSGHVMKEVISKLLHWQKNWLRSMIYPGLDLHTRNRASLCSFWKSGPRDVLDAGCGNGYFAWLAYQSGASVLALSFDSEQVAKARDFLFGYKKVDQNKLQIEHYNLYDLPKMTRKFDEIICYEVLEHLRRDEEVLREFYRLLNPNGVLHLCCPYRLHPQHQVGPIDSDEIGGHVRSGYTESDYRTLLESVGFRIDVFSGIGSPALYQVDRILRAVRNRFGDVLALPLLPVCLPFVWTAKSNPAVPFSLYVRALKLDEVQ